MTHFEDFLETDLFAASQVASQEIPDVVAALDQLIPRLLSGGDRMMVRRYCRFIDIAAQELAYVPARHAHALPSPAFIHEQLWQCATALPWTAPTSDGLGITTVMVDRLRGFASGLPQEYVQPRHDVDEHYYLWFCKSFSVARLEREYSTPLRRAMATLNLSSSDVGNLMGVSRQAVEKWEFTGLPAERAGKIGAIAEIADILKYRLQDGMPALVARREAKAYGGRTMLDLIGQDEHEWLLQSVKESFDFARVA